MDRVSISSVSRDFVAGSRRVALFSGKSSALTPVPRYLVPLSIAPEVLGQRCNAL